MTIHARPETENETEIIAAKVRHLKQIQWSKNI